MGTPTTPGAPAVLPNAHSALINNTRDEFDLSSSFPSPPRNETELSQ